MHPLGVVPKAKVDCWQSALGFIILVFASFDYVDWISQTGRLVDSVFNRISGGTLSAPTGCSPRDYGRMLVFGCSLRNVCFFLFHSEVNYI